MVLKEENAFVFLLELFQLNQKDDQFLNWDQKILSTDQSMIMVLGTNR